MASEAKDPWLLDAPRDSTVVLKISSTLFGFQFWNPWNGRTSYAAEVGRFPDGNLSIKGESNWRDEGWAWMQEFKLKKVWRDNKKTIVEMRTPTANIKLYFAQEITDVNRAFKELVFVGDLNQFKASDYYKTEIMNHFLPRIFKDRLAAIPLETQMKLLEGVGYDCQAIDGEDFKNSYYLVLRGAETVVYDSNQVNQPERTARTMEKLINLGISRMADVIDTPGVNGLKIETKVFFTETQNTADAQSENLSAYLTFDNLKQFKEADITNQQLVDKSFILVNGNRVQVSLTQFR